MKSICTISCFKTVVWALLRNIAKTNESPSRGGVGGWGGGGSEGWWQAGRGCVCWGVGGGGGVCWGGGGGGGGGAGRQAGGGLHIIRTHFMGTNFEVYISLLYKSTTCPGTILCTRPAKGRRRNNLRSSLTG